MLRRDTADDIRGRGSERGDNAKEQMAIGRGRPTVLEIIEDRITDDRGQRIRGRMAALPLRNVQPLIAPIHIVESQRRDLASTQTVRNQQQEDRIIATAYGGAPIDLREHASDLLPGHSARNPGQAMGLGCAHRSAQVLGDVSVPMEVAQEDAQHPASIPDTRLG
jgi:hypothetical protein